MSKVTRERNQLLTVSCRNCGHEQSYRVEVNGGIRFQCNECGDRRIGREISRIHVSHRFPGTGPGPRWYEEHHCDLCGLGDDDERIEGPCFEEPPDFHYAQ